jgi:carboxymethylenebutenolidase
MSSIGTTALHAFLAVDRPSYRPAAASAGWLRVRDFLARHLAS